MAHPSQLASARTSNRLSRCKIPFLFNLTSLSIEVVLIGWGLYAIYILNLGGLIALNKVTPCKQSPDAVLVPPRF